MSRWSPLPGSACISTVEFGRLSDVLESQHIIWRLKEAMMELEEIIISQDELIVQRDAEILTLRTGEHWRQTSENRLHSMDVVVERVILWECHMS